MPPSPIAPAGGRNGWPSRCEQPVLRLAEVAEEYLFETRLCADQVGHGCLANRMQQRTEASADRAREAVVLHRQVLHAVRGSDLALRNCRAGCELDLDTVDADVPDLVELGYAD